MVPYVGPKSKTLKLPQTFQAHEARGPFRFSSHHLYAVHALQVGFRVSGAFSRSLCKAVRSPSRTLAEFVQRRFSRKR